MPPIANDAVTTAQRTRATTDAHTDHTYTLAQATAQRGHRVTLSTATTADQVAIAAADVAAYADVHQQYSLPYTGYLHGLATLRQSLTSQLVSAAEALTTGRNAASATHSVTVADAARVRDLAPADAARDHDLADAAAQYQQTSGQISATGALATALATPAVQ